MNRGRRLSPEEAAERIGVTVGTLAVWRCTGRHKLPYHKPAGRIFYYESDVNAFVEAGRKVA